MSTKQKIIMKKTLTHWQTNLLRVANTAFTKLSNSNRPIFHFNHILYRLMMKNFFLLLFVSGFVSGFQTMTTLQRVSMSLQPHLSGANSEEDATYLMAKAKECAYSDYGYSVEDAKLFLRELMHVQSGCVVGTIVGRDLCDNQEQVAKIVKKLQKKIEKEQAL